MHEIFMPRLFHAWNLSNGKLPGNYKVVFLGIPFTSKANDRLISEDKVQIWPRGYLPVILIPNLTAQ